MRVFAWVKSVLHRLPLSSEVLADFSRLVASDSSRLSIEQCLETVLERSLMRPVIVIPEEPLPKHEKTAGRDDGGWNMDRRTIAAWFEDRQFGPTAEAKLTTLFGGVPRAPERISALVPILSSSGSRVATVVVGKRWSLPLADAEHSLIAAVVGTATLLLEQARLRERLGVAAQAETVKRMVEDHRQRVLQKRLDQCNPN